MARIIFRVDPSFGLKSKAGAERAWLQAAAGNRAGVDRAIRFRQFPPVTAEYAKKFPREAARIRELRGDYYRASCAGWAGRERYREQLLRAAWAVACARA